MFGELEAARRRADGRLVRRRFARPVKMLIAVALLVVAGGLATVGWVWWSYPVPALRDTTLLTVRLLAHDEELATVYGGTRASQHWVPIANMPPFLIDAVLIAEDRRFFQHPGLDLLASVRAALVNLRHSEVVQGASTITQQLARTLFLSSERTWARKMREAILAVQIEMGHPKIGILEAYLNSVYMGHDGDVAVHGVAAAARHFLGKELTTIRLEEAALLAAAIRAPNRILAGDAGRARRRRNIVLAAMGERGLVPDATVREAMARPLRRQMAGATVRAPYFSEMALAELTRRTALPASGELRVATTLDLTLQQAAEAAVRDGLARLERSRPPSLGRLQAGVVALEPSTGKIRAVVGGRRYLESPFNRAVHAKRQPGSLFKPIVYLAAFEAERSGGPGPLTPAALLSDEPVAIPTPEGFWSPQNMVGRFHGPVTVRRAVEESLNVPAVLAAHEVGLPEVIRVAQAVGVQSRLAPVPSLALGTSELSLLEITVAFATLANGGVRVHPTTLDLESTPAAAITLASLPAPTQAVSPESAFLMTHLLRGVMQRGTGAGSARWGLSEVTAGKTGTTEGLRDAWFVGYTPDLVIGVWVGADDGRPVGVTGAQTALPIWATVMRAAVRRARPSAFEPPPGVIMVPVDRGTGLPTYEGCEHEPGAPIAEAFRLGSAPDPVCVQPALPPAPAAPLAAD